MAILKLSNFSGEIPRQPPHMLPDNAAALAVNCDFAHGELRPLRGLGTTKTAALAVRSVFSDDGLRFFAWSKPTQAFQSPTIDDTLERVYFSNDDGFRVTRRSQMKLNSFGPPVESWRVGLPVPGTPTIAVKDGAENVTVTLQRENGSDITQVSVTNTQVIAPGREYLFTIESAGTDGGDTGGATQTGGVVVGGTIEVTGIEIVESGITPASGESEDPTPVTPYGTRKIIGIPSYNTPIKKFATYPQPYGYKLEEPFNITVLGPEAVYADGSKYWGGDANKLTFSNVINVRYNGQWVPLSSLVTSSGSGVGGEGDLGGIVAKVQGEGWEVYSSGGIVPSTRSDILVTASMEGSDKVRVKIEYAGTQSVAYIVTFTNDWLEESAASAPVLVELDELQQAEISLDYSGYADGRPILGMNVYRTYSSSSTYILVNSSPVQGAFTDTTTEPQSAVTLDTIDWDPPHERLKNLTYVGNGFFAGSVGKDLYFSEPYHPHAWPYAMTFTHGIVGVLSIEGGLLVTTLAGCYTVFGAHPEQMTQQVVSAEQAGIAQRSMVRVGGTAVFASNDGMVEVSGSQAGLTSSQMLFTRKDWRNAYLSDFKNLVFGAHDGYLIGVVDPSYPAAASGNASHFVLRLDEAGGTFTRLELTTPALGCSVVPVVDALYLGLGNGFAEFGVGEPLPLTWVSKDFVFPAPVAFGAVIADGTGRITMEVYGDGYLVHSQVLNLDKYKEGLFRLPAVGSKKVWRVKFTGTGTLRRFEMGTSYGELKNG